MFERRVLVRPACALLFAVCALPAAAQKESVKPGINKSFENPNVEDFIGRFEREGRDAFDHRNEILEACQVTPGMAVADVGAGTGLFTRMFAEAVGPEGRVYAVDISEEFLDHIHEMAKRDDLENVTTVLCDPVSSELPENSVDLVYICDTYHHFEYPQRTMASIHRALKPDGVLVLVDYHRIPGKTSGWLMEHIRAPQEVFVQEITDAGFEQIDEKPDMLGESYFVRFKKAKPVGKGPATGQ